MNILIVSLRGPTNEDRRGGAQDYIQFVSSPWGKQGHDVTILCSHELVDNKLLPDNELVEGINVVRVGSPMHRILPLVKETRRISSEFDVVIENIMGFPVFLPLALKSSVPLIAVKHHYEGLSFIQGQGWVKGLIGLALEEILQPLVYRSTSFVVVSTKTLDEHNDKWITPRGKIAIVPPGIAPLNLNPDADKYPDPTVVYYGALDTGRKKIDDLISAFSKVVEKIPEAKLIIGGQGPDSKMLEKMAENLPVVFKGFLSEEDKCELLERGWIFSSPSLTEGFGITWVEANAAGLPVVTYDLGLDTINDSCARLVPKGDVDALADSIEELLTDDKLRSIMAVSARENSRRFDWVSSSNKFMSLIDKVLDR